MMQVSLAGSLICPPELKIGLKLWTASDLKLVQLLKRAVIASIGTTTCIRDWSVGQIGRYGKNEGIVIRQEKFDGSLQREVVERTIVLSRLASFQQQVPAVMPAGIEAYCFEQRLRAAKNHRRRLPRSPKWDGDEAQSLDRRTVVG